MSLPTDFVDVRAAPDGQVSSALIRDGHVVARQTIRFDSAANPDRLTCTYGSGATITPLIVLWVTNEQHDELTQSNDQAGRSLAFARGWSAMMWLGVVPINSSGWTWHYRFNSVLTAATRPAA